MPIAIKLNFKTTNNIAEYKAYIIWLKVALELRIEELEVFGESILIISQISVR